MEKSEGKCKISNVLGGASLSRSVTEIWSVSKTSRHARLRASRSEPNVNKT